MARFAANVAYLMVQDNEKADKALEYANKAVQLSPDNPEVIDTYAYVLYYNSRFDEAAERARAALQLYEAQEATVPAEVYQHLGMIMDALGNKDEALAAYQKALELGVDSLSDKSKEQIKEAVKKLGN
jgi:Flp pilus assembly protein TadD